MAARYRSPDNLEELLDRAFRSASRARFYAERLGGAASFEQVPLTPLAVYRRQRLADVLAAPSRVNWIAGPYGGQRACSVAAAEGDEETEVRYELLADAVTGGLESSEGHTAVVAASSRRLWFGAETAAVLTRAGIPAHLTAAAGGSWARRFLRETSPGVVVVLSDAVTEGDLPCSVGLCVTFRRPGFVERARQVDLYLVEEIGLLAQSDGCGVYAPNRDVFHFERSGDGYLVVTSLYNAVRPVVRIKTEDRVDFTGDGSFRLTGPSRS